MVLCVFHLNIDSENINHVEIINYFLNILKSILIKKFVHKVVDFFTLKCFIIFSSIVTELEKVDDSMSGLNFLKTLKIGRLIGFDIQERLKHQLYILKYQTNISK